MCKLQDESNSIGFRIPSEDDTFAAMLKLDCRVMMDKILLKFLHVWNIDSRIIQMIFFANRRAS
jgi:hypothetical protein